MSNATRTLSGAPPSGLPGPGPSAPPHCKPWSTTGREVPDVAVGPDQAVGDTGPGHAGPAGVCTWRNGARPSTAATRSPSQEPGGPQRSGWHPGTAVSSCRPCWVSGRRSLPRAAAWCLAEDGRSATRAGTSPFPTAGRQTGPVSPGLVARSRPERPCGPPTRLRPRGQGPQSGGQTGGQMLVNDICGDALPRARPVERSSAASSATSHERSTGLSSRRAPQLTMPALPKPTESSGIAPVVGSGTGAMDAARAKTAVRVGHHAAPLYRLTSHL